MSGGATRVARPASGSEIATRNAESQKGAPGIRHSGWPTASAKAPFISVGVSTSQAARSDASAPWSRPCSDEEACVLHFRGVSPELGERIERLVASLLAARPADSGASAPNVVVSEVLGEP